MPRAYAARRSSGSFTAPEAQPAFSESNRDGDRPDSIAFSVGIVFRTVARLPPALFKIHYRLGATQTEVRKPDLSSRVAGGRPCWRTFSRRPKGDGAQERC